MGGSEHKVSSLLAPKGLNLKRPEVYSLEEGACEAIIKEEEDESQSQSEQSQSDRAPGHRKKVANMNASARSPLGTHSQMRASVNNSDQRHQGFGLDDQSKVFSNR